MAGMDWNAVGQGLHHQRERRAADREGEREERERLVAAGLDPDEDSRSWPVSYRAPTREERADAARADARQAVREEVLARTPQDPGLQRFALELLEREPDCDPEDALAKIRAEWTRRTGGRAPDGRELTPHELVQRACGNGPKDAGDQQRAAQIRSLVFGACRPTREEPLPAAAEQRSQPVRVRWGGGVDRAFAAGAAL